jgi:aminoglycoside phosphotransferase (APT) family kinase protein
MTLDQGALVHGDFAMSSLLVDGQSFTGVIDFGDAFIGDPLMDIAYFRFKEITKSYGHDIYRRLLRHYTDARKIILDDELEQKIVFYMIYWGLKRLEHCPDQELRKKFAAKLRMVCDIWNAR